jgi:uncharacterized protein (TIGR03086 family)
MHMSIELLKKAIAGFSAEVAATPDSDWSKMTKCDGWTVTDLMTHMVGGARSAAVAFRGGSRDEAIAAGSGDVLGDNPRAAFEASLAEHIAAYESMADNDAVVHHPAADMPASRVLMFRIGDYLLHTWDLAAGLGREVTLDREVCEYVYANLEPMAPMLGSIGMFGAGPSGDVPSTADIQTRVLDISGRRP